jgi:aconitate hydratase
MTFDLDMIKAFYKSYPKKVQAAKKALGRPLTLAEKILYAHIARHL